MISKNSVVFAFLLLVIVGLSTPSRASAQTFNDVPTNYWAYSFIEILAENGITAGCGNGNYCPTDQVTRDQMAVFLERGINGSAYVPPPATGTVFNDVAASDFAAAWIEQLAADGITAGCGNGNYCPGDAVTRDQMAVFLLRAKYGAAYMPPAATGVFSDVPTNAFAAAWIEQLAAEGITSGCGGGNYCPANPVTRDQMAVFLVRSFIVPTARAGGPYSGDQGADIALDGSASTEPDNDIVSYEWDLDNDGAYDDATGVSAIFNSAAAGVFTIRLRATDSDGYIDTDTTTVTVNNVAPTADAQSVTTIEDTALPITLTGTDPGSDPLTYAIATGPGNGALSGTAPNVTYTPNAGYVGPDSFTFTVNDGEFTSAAATVSITVDPANTAPAADAQSVSTGEDTPLAITLTGSDPQNDPLTFAIATGPGNGALGGTLPNVTYTPNANYSGPDSFTFTVSDAEFTSAEATVSITVVPVNDPPTADAQSVSTSRDTPVLITLTASDPEGDPLTFGTVTGPSNGALSGTVPNVTYTPNPNYFGPDSFTFLANDGMANSAPATVSITVNDVTAPVAPSGLFAVGGNGRVTMYWANNVEPDLAGYRVYRSLTQGGPYTEIAGPLVPSSYTDLAVTNGTPYFYVLTAEDDLGNISDFSVEVETTPNAPFQSYWKLDEGAGVTAFDSIRSSDGTIAGATWTTGVSGAALDFDGIDDRVVIDNTSDLHITGNKISLVAWINPRDGGASFGSRVISKRTDAGGSDVFAMITDNYRLRFRLDGQDMDSSYIFRLNEWQHVAMVYDESDMRIYVNGVLDIATPLAKSDPIDASSRAVFLGSRENEARFFNGLMDEVRVYNRALSAAEVQTLHGQDIPPAPPAPPVGPWLTDITESAGTEGPVDGGHGVMFAEVDNDSLPDLYITNNLEFTGPRREFFFDNTDGNVFSEVAQARGIDDVDGGSHGAVWADLDNDGDYDLVNGATWDIANPSGGNPENDSVYRNDGFGVFTDVTPASILAREIETRGITAFDWDGDGDLDLFGVSGSNTPGDNEAFRNDGNFAFTLVNGVLSTVIAMQGVTDTDYDGDGDIDILAANRAGEFAILQNDGTGTFTQISPAALGITASAGDGITTADVDNDGDLDLLLVSDGTASLYSRETGGTYSNLQDFSSIEGYMGGFADLDNDGDQDLIFAGDERLFVNEGSGTFVSGQSVPVNEIDDPRAIAFADIEGDGDLDFAIAARDSGNYLIRNDIDADAGNFLRVELVSPQCQAGAFGAKTRVYAAGDLGGTLLGMRESKGNHGYLGQDEPVLHFGLADVNSVDVLVVFVDGSTTTRLGVAANQRILIDECPP